MSGIEIAGLVVGVVPIVAEVLKSYSATRNRLKAFARFAQVIADVQLRYEVAAANFNNNCQLLLQPMIQDPREVSEMLKDTTHSNWNDASLEERFRNFLECDYQLFEGIVVKIRDLLRETKAMMSKLDWDASHHSDSPRQVAQRLAQAFNIACRENQYRRCLEEIDVWNGKLGILRKQRCKLRKHVVVASSILIRKAAPKKVCRYSCRFATTE